jgi:hypothetical protein
MLTVSHLCICQVDAAFPLMQSAVASLTLEEWRLYATGMEAAHTSSGPRGIMVAKAPNGVLRGAFIYTVEECDAPTATDRTLVVRHPVVPLLGEQLASELLAESMQELARKHRCAGVVISLPPDAACRCDFFRMRGYHVVTESPRLPGHAGLQ